MTNREQRLQQLMRSFEEQANKAAQLQTIMQDLQGTGRSPDGAVTVTVAPSGAVLGLRLSSHAMNRSHTALQQDILNAIRQATQNAAQHMEEALAPVLGDQLEQFKQGMQASGVEPIRPEAAPTVAAEQMSFRTGASSNPQSHPTSGNRQRRDDIEDEEPPGPIMR